MAWKKGFFLDNCCSVLEEIWQVDPPEFGRVLSASTDGKAVSVVWEVEEKSLVVFSIVVKDYLGAVTEDIRLGG